MNVRRCAALLVLLALAHAATSQVIRTEPSQSEAAPQPVTDLLGRTTPRSSIAGFVRAVDRGDFVSAARYMQLTSAQRPNAEALAVSLKGLMDRYLTEALVNISDNGICERFHKTLLDEFYRVAFRKKLYRTLEELQADLDVWVSSYKGERTHQGRWCYGKTPMQTFIDTLPIAKEKQVPAESVH